MHLSVAATGEGPLVVLLHGFPECGWCWRHQVAPLVEAGHRVVVPDQRGYGASDKPRGARHYRAAHLADDVAGLLDAEGADRAVVVGHDWGGAIAWEFAMRHPARLERLATLNAPHPVGMARALRTRAQRRRSRYMFFFQLPWLPERSLQRGDFAGFRRMWRTDPTREGAYTDEDVEHQLDALRVPGALTGALNWYRAAFRHDAKGLRSRRRVVEHPVRVIWGARDRYLGPELATPPAEWAPNAEVHLLPDASHWVQADAPDEVNALLLEFLATQA